MKIGEFAALNQVTTKLLRHYDEYGLLKPESVDPETGYREYCLEQSHRLNWILILKNLDFSLLEIKMLLSNIQSTDIFLEKLVQKRSDIGLQMNERMTKRVQLDRLIRLIYEEGFSMNSTLDLMSLTQDSVQSIKKQMANPETFLEDCQAILATVNSEETFVLIRADIRHFKEVNDTNGYEVGDMVIVKCYQILEAVLMETNKPYAIGRAGGDEFIICLKATLDQGNSLVENACHQFERTDFKALGCFRSISMYFGILSMTGIQKNKLREGIDDTHSIMLEARENDDYPLAKKIFIEREMSLAK